MGFPIFLGGTSRSLHRWPQRYQDANALYTFKSRGFGGEVGLVTADSPPAPALCALAVGQNSTSFLIQIKVPRPAHAYAVIIVGVCFLLRLGSHDIASRIYNWHFCPAPKRGVFLTQVKLPRSTAAYAVIIVRIFFLWCSHDIAISLKT